jgi:hypothetical protein
MRAWAVGSAVAAVISGVCAISAWRAISAAIDVRNHSLGDVRRDVLNLTDEIVRVRNELLEVRHPTQMAAERVEAKRFDLPDDAAIIDRLTKIETDLLRLSAAIESSTGVKLGPGNEAVQKNGTAVSQAIVAVRDDPKTFLVKHAFWFSQDIYRAYGAPDRVIKDGGTTPLWVYAGIPGEGGFAIRIGISGLEWATTISPDMIETWPNSKPGH